MSEIIFLSNVRLSFPNIAEPQRQVNEVTGVERLSYNCELLMPPDHPGVQQFMQRYGEIALTKWKENAQAIMQMIQSERRMRCFGRGEEKIAKKTLKPYDGYAGNIYITAGRDTPPQMIQADRKLRCFGRGEEKVNKKTFQPYDGYAGHVFITAGRDSQPQA